MQATYAELTTPMMLAMVELSAPVADIIVLKYYVVAVSG